MKVGADRISGWPALVQGGRIGVVGVYAGFTNHFNIGAFMEKGLTMRAGQAHAPTAPACVSLLPCAGSGSICSA